MKLPPETIGVAEAKRDLTKLIDAVLAGKSVTIARRGKAVARLVPVEKPRFWKWSLEHTIPDDDPFWDGPRRTRAWRKEPLSGPPR